MEIQLEKLKKIDAIKAEIKKELEILGEKPVSKETKELENDEEIIALRKQLDEIKERNKKAEEKKKKDSKIAVAIEMLKDELAAYNPLIPDGKELVATLMFEIDNPLSRAEFLNKVGGIEEKVFLKINGEIINSIPEQDVDRTSAEGKASSVQFLHFQFTDKQIEKFKDIKKLATIGIEHDLYNHMTKISEHTSAELINDFS